ncbi:MAG TPA: hypothetical protein VNY07_08815 [Chthoniobacterales bacterium]|nr:hypothetical protein [Chthoniobacterales bacterium]
MLASFEACVAAWENGLQTEYFGITTANVNAPHVPLCAVTPSLAHVIVALGTLLSFSCFLSCAQGRLLGRKM